MLLFQAIGLVSLQDKMGDALQNVPPKAQIKFLLDRDKLDLALPLMQDEGNPSIYIYFSIHKKKGSIGHL